MGDWGGAPEGWVPPEERKEAAAAAEAAAAMEARRAQDDERSASVAGAIRDGLGMIAAAIMVAGGQSPGYALEKFEEVWSGLVDPDGSTMAPPPPVDDIVDAQVVDDDPDMDDLLSTDGG